MVEDSHNTHADQWPVKPFSRTTYLSIKPRDHLKTDLQEAYGGRKSQHTPIYMQIGGLSSLSQEQHQEPDVHKPLTVTTTLEARLTRSYSGRPIHTYKHADQQPAKPFSRTPPDPEESTTFQSHPEITTSELQCKTVTPTSSNHL